MLHRNTVILIVLSLLMVSALMATTNPNSSTTLQKMSQMPLAFTKNMGQWDEGVLFRADVGGATMWFTKDGITYQFFKRIAKDSTSKRADMILSPDKFAHERDSVETMTITAKFIGANPNPEVVGEGLMEYKCNYFLGNNPAKWQTDVPNYGTIILKDIYPGIDLKYSGDGPPQAGQATYEFVIAPGADIAQIKVEYEGAEETSCLDSAGSRLSEPFFSSAIRLIWDGRGGLG